MLPQQPCSRSGTWYAVDPAGYGDARTYLIKAVRSCYPTIAQAHERLPIANAGISCSQAAGMTARRATAHL
jgi:hypothetical protein